VWGKREGLATPGSPSTIPEKEKAPPVSGACFLFLLYKFRIAGSDETSANFV
jgi:hypothetical protein